MCENEFYGVSVRVNNKLVNTVLIFVGGVLAVLLMQWLIYPKPIYVAELPDGSVYDGDMLNQRFHGQGELVWKGGSNYEGEFKNGVFHGKGKISREDIFEYEGDFSEGLITGIGVLKYPDHSTYKGEVKNGLMNGKGTLELKGSTYEGDFKKNVFHGEGKLSYPTGMFYQGEFENGILTSGRFSDGKGSTYTGGFKDWGYEGQGTLDDYSQGKYIGVFSYGALNGEGEHYSKEGNYYKGQFDYGQYQGEGRLEYKNGDVYEGGFSYGSYSGKGEIVYAKPKEGVASRSGIWKYGKLVESDDGQPLNSPSSLNEIALYNQTELMEQARSDIDSNNPNEIDLYFLGISGDGTQAVFRREIQFVETLFKDKFNTTGKSAVLINSRDTVKDVPLATTTSIKKTLGYLAEKMDVEQDILFIYMSSHGSKKGMFKLEQSGLSLPELSAKSLAEMLDAVGIKWKVVVVSACYSGLFIPELQDEHSLIITAAAEDKKSFGCSDEADFTYFGDAYFNQALKETSDFVEAFELAVAYVKTREQAKKYKASEPQIHKPEDIVDYLAKWRNRN